MLIVIPESVPVVDGSFVDRVTNVVNPSDPSAVVGATLEDGASVPP